MKVTFIFLAISIASFSAISQEQQSFFNDRHSDLLNPSDKNIRVSEFKNGRMLDTNSRIGHSEEETASKLDSVIVQSVLFSNEMEYSSRRDYTYDGDNKEIVYSDWDEEAKTWVYSSKVYFSQTETEIIYNSWLWNSSNKIWENNYKYHDIFNDGGQYIYSDAYHYENGKWAGIGKYYSEFNQQNLLELHTIYDWNYETEDWEISKKIKYNYDVEGRRIEEEFITPTGAGGTLKPSLRIEYVYANSGQLFKENTYADRGPDDSMVHWLIKEYFRDGKGQLVSDTLWVRWNHEDINFEYSSATNYSYDERGAETRNESYSWDDIEGKWRINSYYEKVYDENGNKVKSESWYDNNGSGGGSRYETKFNSEGKVIESVTSFFQYSIQKWVPSTKYFRSYNEHGIAEILNYNWSEELSDWVWATMSNYYYSGKILDVDEKQIHEFDLLLMPNPATHVFEICHTKNLVTAVEIYNFKGQVVRRFNSEQTHYSVEGLPSGLYSVLIKSDNEIYQQKLAIR